MKQRGKEDRAVLERLMEKVEATEQMLIKLLERSQPPSSSGTPPPELIAAAAAASVNADSVF